MNKHASMNRTFRLVRNDVLGTWVPVAETARARGKRSGRSAAVLAAALAAIGAGWGPSANAGGTAPAPTELPTGGNVVAGGASITSPGAAVLDIDQSTQRAVIDWSTFNVGSAAQVNFNQPNSSSATLNRVLDSNPSQIFGRITAPGQVFLTNPNGVHFGKSASVDVGGLAATTHGIEDADFMAGDITLKRNGATGSVVNEGELRAAIGGYIALLAPEVRNSGVVIARLGTVAMAAGESITLSFDGNHLAGISVEPATIAALVENKGAVLAPGGLIILSAQALDRLQGGVVNNSGTLEATGLSTKGGRIVLQASDSIENSGAISADAGADGSPAGSVTVEAPAILNSGTISAAADAAALAAVIPPVSGGSIDLVADSITQSASGTLDVSGASGGSVTLQAAQDITVGGSISAAADDGTSAAEARGGSVALTAGHDVTLQDVVVDVSGSAAAGAILIEGGLPLPSDPPVERPTVALLGNSQLRSSSRNGRGGTVVLTADRVGLFGDSSIDASGAAGGGDVFVGGGFHGKDPSIANARQVVVGSNATIDASATQAGDGGNVAIWSDGQTTYAGSIAARGGAAAGAGGFVEVSGKENLQFLGTVDASSAHGAAGTLLLDPRNIVIDAAGAAAITDVDQFADTPASDSTIAPSTITAITNAGTAVTLQANNDITVNSSILTANPAGTGGALTFQAGRSITLNGSITSDDGNITFVLNDAGADANRVAGTAAVFQNNTLIDAGTGTVSITMGTKDQSGTISTGQITAGTFNITHNGPTAGATTGAIDLGEITVSGDMTLTANSARNVTNTLGSVIVRGTATIGVGTGDVTINRATTDFNILGLTAGNVTLADTNAMRFAATNLSGNLVQTAQGPIAQTGDVLVAGTTNLSVTSGGFGYADPQISLSNAGNDFGGAVTLSVPSTGATGTGGYAMIRDSGAINIAASNTATSLQVQAGGATTLGTTTAGTSISVTSSAGAVNLATTTAGTSLSITAAGAVGLGTTTVGSDLTVNTAGAITDSGTITVGNQTVLTAGAANDVTLDDANNNFNAIRIISANNVTLVDKTGINFGSSNTSFSGFTSNISGNLNVTAGGDISQNRYWDANYSAITVSGATTFTANHASAPINLYLGPNDPFSGSSGSNNNFVGGVTLARNNVSTGFTNVQLRNINSTASVLTGLTTVGALNNVYLRFDSAPSVALPGMTLNGSLKLNAPSVVNTATVPGNKITQTGAIVVAGDTVINATSSGDIEMTNAGNNFNRFGIINGRNVTVVDTNAIDLYGAGYNFDVYGNLTVTAGGNITDSGNRIHVAQSSAGVGTATFNAGSNNITLDTDTNEFKVVAITAANDVVLRPRWNLTLGTSTIAGTLFINSRDGGSLTQSGTVTTGTSGTTTFGNFNAGITLTDADNVFANLAISNAAAVNIREDHAITQASAWSFSGTNGGTNSSRHTVTLATSDDQAITLDQANVFGNLTITQHNNGASSAGAVYVRETSDTYFGMTQGNAWTVHGTTRLDSGATSINLNQAGNVFGPLQVTGATGNTNGVASTVTLYARNTASADAITDVGGPGAWNTGTGAVRLVAYDTTGTTGGGGNINLSNAGNVLGDLYIKATNATITENGNITDGATTIWNSANDTGWVTTGTTNLIVANPTGKSITLDNLTNQIGPLALNTTGTAGTLASVLITDNTDLTQAAVWNVGAAPVTLDARNHLINLSSSGNVLGAITINTTNGMPTGVSITEDDAITQGSAWVLSGVPVTLVAENGKAITLTNASNILGNVTLTGGTVSLTENDAITQGGAWTTTGTTTLNATSNAITLTHAGNVLGSLAISGAPSAVSITENDDITQASAWAQGTSPFTLNAGAHDILLSQAGNQLGDLTLTAQNATVTENHAAGITDGGAWNIAGTTTLTAGNANPIVLNANPAGDLGTVSIVSASNADINDLNGIVFDTSTIAAGGTLTVTAGGAITQIGAITAPSLRLIGTGNATLTNASNNVATLAAGFSGGDLVFTNGGNFAIGVVGGTSGVTIGANDVTLTSATGTVTGLSNVNASSSSLTITTGTALSLPQLAIAGAQTYTASTVSGSGITLTANVTSTSAGAINFMSPVTLAADLSIQSTNSPINFSGTLAGAGHQLTVNAGTGAVAFNGAVSGLGSTGDAGAALQLTSSGATFESTLGANNGLAITGPVVFKDTVTLADGNAASVFTGLVTLGKPGGMNLSGYDGMTFNGGVLLQNGPATINSNNSPLAFQTAGTVSGPYGLTLNSGTGSLVGLDRMGSDLTSLSVTAFNPTIPSGGLSIAGAQSYTATGGSSITLNGNVTSTAAGAITFNGPVTVGASSTVSSTDSDITFAGSIDGNKDLTVSSGTGTKTFSGAVGGVTSLGDGTGAAIVLQGAGATTFSQSVKARSGITAAGAVSFMDDVELSNGDTGSTFGGLVTSGGADGNFISGYDGISFNGGLALSGGFVAVASNGSTLNLGGPVTGASDLALNALAGGSGVVTGLDQIGINSDITLLTVVAQTLDLPATGLAVAGSMIFNAPGGITLNGAVGNSSGPATGQIEFNGPVTLATGPIAVATGNANVIFNGTVNGAQALTVNAGTGTTTFGAAVGGTTALTSVTTDAGGTTAINGGSIRTTGAQSYNDAVTLGANTTLTGANVSFGGTLNGAHALTVNDSGTTTFAGLVGGTTALSSLTTDAPGSVAVNTTAVTTSGAQTYNDAVVLGANAGFNGVGITFGAGVDGARTLTANAGSGALRFDGTVGGSTALTSLSATGNTVAVADATTSGAQTYAANGGVALAGNLTTTNSNVTVTGPTTLAGNVAIHTGAGAGDIVFTGGASTINGAYNLALTAGAGNVVLGGVVGGVTPLAGISISGNNLTLPGIATAGDANQSYTALNNITLNQSRTLNAPISFTADADSDGSGAFILLNGVSLTASNNTLSIQAADLDLQGNSTLSSGSGLMTLTASNGRNLALGGADAAGQMTISGSELSRISSSGGLDLRSTGSGWVRVDGITASQSQNITGVLGLRAQGTGDVSFLNAASTFNALTANAAGGSINVGVNLTTTNDAIVFATPVAVSGASTINSGGGDITFQGTLDVDNDLTLGTGNGVLSFGGAVGSNRTLTLNLGGGSVSGLGQLQSSLTGLTVNGSSGITLPAFTINGPQVYNTGPITVTGNLGGVGITFNNLVDVVPASGTALAMNAGTGTLAFTNLVSFNATDMTLTADEIDFSRAITGSGSLLMQPYTGSRNVAVGGSGAPIVGLNLTAAELAWLPIGTLSSLTLGSASGTGSLDIAGALNAPGRPLTLNGGGGITQSGGAITSGALTLYAAGNPISLANSANAFGAVAINGTPSSVSLVNTLDISQLGTAGWNLGSATVTLNAGAHDITLGNAGNTFGTLALTGGDVQVTEDAATDLGASSVGGNLTVASSGGIHVSGPLAATGNVSLTSAGVVTQAAPLTIGGNLDVVTSVNAGDVTIDNSGAASTSIGNTRVGGNYVLTATGDAVSQAAGSSLQVRGDLTVTGSSIVLGGAGNLIGGTTTLPATNTVVVRQSGVITLLDRVESGNLTVISERTNRSFGGPQVSGNAVLLNDSANNIGGSISVSASAPTVNVGADQQTGIVQAAGTSISVTGVASFTAEASGAGSLGIDLTNDGNSFGTLQLSGTTVNVKNSATGLTTIDSALAQTSLVLSTAGGVAQTGPISAPTLAIDAAGSVTLNNIANNVNTLSVASNGNAISYVDANDVAVAGIDAGGADVSLTAGGSGNLTQTAALANVGTLSVHAGGAVTLGHAGNTVGALGTSTAGTGLQVFDSAGGLAVSGAVRTNTGDMLIRTAGDLTLNAGSSLEALAGDVVASTEGAGNFINNSGASALVVGSGRRWLVYSDTPDLVAGAHTVKGGLTSDFRHYGATYASYLPAAVTELGNGFIYESPASTLTVSATIVGTPSHVYGDTPTGTLSYTISSGLLDSEDDIGSIITGGTATYSAALADTMNAGTYEILYTGGLASQYTLVADTDGATYTVTPAVLTYTANAASRVYGAANPALSGSISGFKLGQDASILSGTATWTTTATTGSNVGQYAITGSGYTAGGNYTFAQAAGNATALTITRAGLVVTANDVSRTYDGTLYSGGAGVAYSGFVNGESASVLGGLLSYDGSSQGARNAGTYSITPVGLTSGNYEITFVGGTLTIGRASLTVTSSDVTKSYDGTLSAAGTAIATAGTQLFGSDSLSGGTYAFTNANAGTGNKTVTVSGVTVSDGNGGGNYDVSYVDNTTSTINPASLTVSSSNVTKTYDGTLAAAGAPLVISGTLYSNASNGNVQDSLSGGTYAFTNANAGTGNKTVTVSGVTVSDGNGGGNYVLTYADNTTSTIDRATLTFAGTIADKSYDGTTDATLAGYALTGLVGSETLQAAAGTAAFSDKNAGTGKTVTISGITLADGTNGGLASNYVVSPTATATGTIDPKLLTVNATVADKVYDGTTNAVLQTYGLSGFVGSETVTGVHTGSVSFVDKNVGNDKAVTITGIVLVNGTNGGLASNYAVAPTAAGTADITPATLQVAGVVAQDKVYDGTLVAYLNTGSAVLAGAIGADDVQVGSMTGTFLSKDVGTDKPIGTGTFVLTGADAGNYTLIQPSGLTASITPRRLNVSAVGVDKVYDGTTAATVNLVDDRIAGDALTLTSTSAFLDKNAGRAKFIDVSDIALGGADAGNYTVNDSASAFANIAQADLTVTAAGVNKVYDGTTAADVVLSASPLGDDELDLGYASASFADRNVGTGKTVTVSGINASGADAGNYRINTVATTTADITGSVTDAVADPGDVADTWTLPPVLPQAPAPVSPVPPVALLDTTMPSGLDAGASGGSSVGSSSIGGGSAVASGAGAGAGAGAADDTVITVSLVREADSGNPGRVSVSVPTELVSSGAGFSFPLPAEVAEAAASGAVQVTLAGGQPLPSWLRYVPATRSFVVSGSPAGALPVTVLVSIGAQQWVLEIAER